MSWGMGGTHKGFDVHLHCRAALKIINAQVIGDARACHRFMREARAVASVRHRNVASVFPLGQRGSNYVYAVEFVEGETLEDLIRRSSRLDADLALELAAEVAAGLSAINEQHLVHRDIRPNNIRMRWEQGRLANVKIIDLGLAEAATEDTLSMMGSFVGTPAYASPEQFAGVGLDIRSDLYSLGVTLWEMISGSLPFQGSAAELMLQHQDAAPPISELKNVAASIVALLQVMLEKDPGRRFQDPVQLVAAIARVKKAIASRSVLSPKELREGCSQRTEQTPKRWRERILSGRVW